MQILNERQEELIRNERKALNDLRLTMVEFARKTEESDLLGKSIEQLDELFLLVVVGEFNSGKSAFINALLGQRILPEGATPTTSQIDVLQYGPEHHRSVVNKHQNLVTYPAAMLREMSIVDTPGTNAIIREHEQITSHFIPRADLVLFITSADRPFTESERQFLVQIRDWGKKIVLIINKADILQNDSDRLEVTRYVCDNARQLLGILPDVFLVSARMALQARLDEDQAGGDVGFVKLEVFIQEKLDEIGRLKLKLLSPLGTGLKVITHVQDIITSRLLLLEKDFQMLADVDAQLAAYDQDLKRDFKFRLADVENPLYELELRGDDFFDNTMRLARVFDLLNKERIRQEFDREVIRDIPHHIDEQVNHVIDWMIGAQVHQWESISKHIADRRQEHQDRIVGDISGSFDYDRARMMDDLGRDARKVIDTFDKNHEAKMIAEDAQTMVTASLAVEAGAIGLGALVTVLATTAAADVTGIVSASVIAALGLFIIPARRKAAKKSLREKISDLRSHLVDSLTKAFEMELTRSQQKVREAITPYTRFVRTESGKLQEAREQFQSIKEELERLAGIIDTLDS
jgi:small GTP-binding protein